ncbi:DUF1064 domain-containing protein [Reyranella sp.]|uniref:DUF1064 domain-containing protein n=1 Tax=Reyranella sp. TaxID=1929291 RepID=UPI00403719E9
MQRNKYGARKTVSGGITFDSKREANRWDDLQALLRGRKISQLERQVRFVLAPGVTLAGETRKKPAIRYVADFRYFDVEKGRFIVEDAKGRDTPVSRIKRHLMKSVHGIDVVLS